MLVGQYYGFSIDTPYELLSDEHKHIVLYGSGEDEIDFQKLRDARVGQTKPSHLMVLFQE
jgi:Excinuclease ATPase subunit